MKTKLLAFVVAALVPGLALAGWHAAGQGYFYWLTPSGQSDGNIYKLVTDSYGQSAYHNLGSYANFVGQQPQQPAAPAQPSAAYSQSYSQSASYEEGESGWRTKLLSLAAKQLEHKQYLEAIRALGVSGVYGVDSPAAAGGGMALYSSKYGGSGVYGDLPLQQGNTVYGSLDPTYNGLADPFRNFDVGAHINMLGSLATQVETGSARVRSDLAGTIQQTTESYRLIRETESRIAGMNETLRLFAEALKANESKTLQIIKGADGVPTLRVIEPPGGPPPAAPDGGAGGAGDFGRLNSLIAARCVDCHGGGKTSSDQKLLLGKGRTPDLSRLTETQAKKIWKRVSDGSMPPGGGLSKEEMAEFDAWFGRGPEPGNMLKRP